MTKHRLERIQSQIEQIKEQLAAIDVMRPGSLTRQYKNRKEKTGAYYQISYTHLGKSRTDYVPADCVPEVRRQIGNYQRFKTLTSRWVALSIEQSRLQLRPSS
jgi:hypothetical protein